MSTHAGPNIVEDGLVLSIDPANQKSYSPNMFPYSTDIFSWTPSATRAVLSRDTISSPVGNKPLKMVPTGNDPYTNLYNVPASNITPVNNGETWTLSVYVKANRATTVELFLFGANSSGTGFVDGSWIGISAKGFSIGTEWTRIFHSITYNNTNVAFLQFRLDGTPVLDSGVEIWWDGIQVEKSSSATPFNPNYYGNIINDLSGNGNNGTIFGDFTFNGNTKVLHSNGVAGSYIDIPSPNLTSSNFTVMSATRYAGASPRGRIISGRSNNWLMGHWSGNANKYYAAGWVSTYTQADEEWRIYCGTGNISLDQYSFWSNKNKLVTNSSGGSAGPNGFSIGRYGPGNSQYSNCDVSFLLAYNRILSDQEIQQNFNALRGRHGL
jgi:hypothetical protein